MPLKNLEDLRKACPLDPSWNDIMKAAGLDVQKLEEELEHLNDRIDEICWEAMGDDA